MKRPSDARLLAMVQYINSLGLRIIDPELETLTPRQVIIHRKLKEIRHYIEELPDAKPN